jgi:hypothetical protein
VTSRHVLNKYVVRRRNRTRQIYPKVKLVALLPKTLLTQKAGPPNPPHSKIAHSGRRLNGSLTSETCSKWIRWLRSVTDRGKRTLRPLVALFENTPLKKDRIYNTSF